MSTQANRLRTLFTRAFAAIGVGAGLTQTIRTIADFGQTMQTVRAITGATEDQFKALSQTARTLGSTTRFSAREAAQGLTFLSRAGFTVSQSLEAIDDTLLLAQAGALDLGRAADIASNVLTGFGLGADQAGRVVDVLAASANTANTTVEQLGQALSFAAPVAAGLGVSVEETSAAINVLSNAGIQATRAGTGLTRVMAELESPSAKTSEILAQLGLNEEDVRVSSVGLTEALDTLAESGISTGQALEAFGQRGGPAIQVLTAGAEDVGVFNENLNDVEGTARRVADVMDMGLNGALQNLRAAFEELQLSFGDVTGSSIEEFIRGLAATIRLLAENIEAAIKVLQPFVILIGANLVRALFRSVAAARAARIEAIALGTAVRANPIGLLVTAIIALVSGFIAFRDELIRIKGPLGDVFRGMDAILNIAENPIFQALFGGEEIEVKIRAQDVASVSDSLAKLTQIPGIEIEEQVKALGFATQDLLRIEQTIIGDAGGSVEEANKIFMQALDARAEALAILQRQKVAQDASADLLTLTIPEQVAVLGRNIRDSITGAKEFSAEFKDIPLTLKEVEANLLLVASGNAGRGTIAFVKDLRQGFEETRDAAAEAFALIMDPNVTDISSVTVGFAAPVSPADQARMRAEEAAEAAALAMALGSLNDQLKLEGELIGLSSIERDVRIARFEAEAAIAQVKNDVDADAAALAVMEIEATARSNALLAARFEILEGLKVPEEDRIEIQARINELLLMGVEGQALMNQLLMDFPSLTEESTSQLDDFANAFINANIQAQKLGETFGNILVNGIGRASDALADFALSGGQNIEELREAMANILADIAKQILAAIIQALILKAITVGAGLPAVPIGGAAGGGAFGAGRSLLVGEKGPELFIPSRSPLSAAASASAATQGFSSSTSARGLRSRQGGGAVQPLGLGGPELFRPPEAGQVVPAAQTAALLANQRRDETVVVPAPMVSVPVTINNVRDPNEIPEALDEPETQEKILNIVSDNREGLARG